MSLDDQDAFLRAAAFAYLDELTTRSGGPVTRAQLEAFTFQGTRIPLAERQKGIRKVAGLEAALSILTTYTEDPTKRPYDDKIGADGYPRYKWQNTDGQLAANRSLRAAMRDRKPLVWFMGVGSAEFEAIYPVYIVGEEPSEHQVVLAVDEAMREQWEPMADLLQHPADLAARRRYADVVVRQRLHQRVFRDRVLLAYERRCALCHLRHPELLQAAHIREDSEGGEPIVPNGIAMCSLHHSAFDASVLGIRPDYRIQIRADVLQEQDGPTLKHALQGLHGEVITLPTQKIARPDPLLLEERFERFRAAG
ncbi:MAG: HNH endonuclease [Actinomycetota bacterium]